MKSTTHPDLNPEDICPGTVVIPVHVEQGRHSYPHIRDQDVQLTERCARSELERGNGVTVGTRAVTMEGGEMRTNSWFGTTQRWGRIGVKPLEDINEAVNWLLGATVWYRPSSPG